MTTTLVLGGARSGKSALSERLVRALAQIHGGAPAYIATAEAWDDEMADRIARHRADRGDGWTTVEEPLELANAISRHGGSAGAVLVDCLTLWLTNRTLADNEAATDAELEAAGQEVLAAAAAAPRPIVFVSNEIGLGVAPSTPLGRRFRDAQGRLNQRAAAAADRVLFVAAGLPLALKGAAWGDGEEGACQT